MYDLDQRKHVSPVAAVPHFGDDRRSSKPACRRYFRTRVARVHLRVCECPCRHPTSTPEAPDLCESDFLGGSCATFDQPDAGHVMLSIRGDQR